MRKRTIGFGLATLTVLTMFPELAHAERCSNGVRKTLADREREAAQTFEDDTCIERDIFFMPGTQAVYFQPTTGLGAFYGAGVQLAPLQISHNNDH